MQAGKPPSISRFSEYVKRLSEQQVLARLRDLDPTQKQIAVRTIDVGGEPDHYRRHLLDVGQLSCRQVNADVRRATPWRRTASFTSLTANAGAQVVAGPLGAPAIELVSAGVESAAFEGRDYDTLDATPPETASVLSSAAGAETPEDAVTTLADFPGGTRTGNFFHDLLEHCDFSAQDHQALIQDKLADHGLPHEHVPLVERSLAEVLSTEVQPGLALRQLANSSRLNELEFTLPAHAHAKSTSDCIESGALSVAFSEHPSPALPASYAESLRQLRFAPLAGFLKGYIDLTFVFEGRWYVVDYKTNNLGPKLVDYRPPQLALAMSHSHYVLQYHLYTLAVHRYLCSRLADYDYARDFGGVLYLFLRGMHPGHGPTTGVYFDKPPAARIEALARLFC
jgi:exodeoxyribonuclease V beta subunit